MCGLLFGCVPKGRDSKKESDIVSCISCEYACEHYVYSEEHQCDIMYRTCEKRHNAPIEDDETCEYDTSRQIKQKQDKLVQKVKWNCGEHPTEMYIYGEADLEANQAMQEPLEKLYQMEDLADGIVQQLEYYTELLNQAMETKNYLSVSKNAEMVSKLAYACQLFDENQIK